MSDNIIQFPGGNSSNENEKKAGTEEAQVSSAGKGLFGLDSLTEDQEKALQIVMEGMSFVLVGIKPTESGADFFTAIHGDKTDLQNAGPHMQSIIDRAYGRKGL